MSMYWIYDLSNWLLCSLIVLTFVGLALVGLFITPSACWKAGGPLAQA